MIASFVLDASLALKWLFPDEMTPAAMALLDRMRNETARVPTLWFQEIANGVAVGERKGRVPSGKGDEFVRLMGSFSFEVDDAARHRSFQQVLTLARRHRLTAYDATYLDLALRAGLPLATSDEALAVAAKAESVEILR